MNLEQKVRQIDNFQFIGLLVIAFAIAAHTLLILCLNADQDRLIERVDQLEQTAKRGER